MKRFWLSAVTLGLLAWSPMPQAAGTVATRSASAAMQVGLRIVDSCAIHAGGNAGANARGAAAQVECAYGTPYQLIQTAAPAASQTAAGKSPSVLTVTF